ncbi:hypothetical protein AMECASPLE_005811 [Ameca splendens]|uniref:Uncharacterized protein n=1 Tax=Ameca splendens TaxID=208324 RepID=A0ABV1A6V1_9TELE
MHPLWPCDVSPAKAVFVRLLCAMERMLLLCQHIPQSDSSAAFHPFRPERGFPNPTPVIPNYSPLVPSGQDRARLKARFMTPFCPPVGQNIVNMMDGAARWSYVITPKGIKYGHIWREGVWRATKGPYVVLNLCLATDWADAPGVSDLAENVQK